MSKPVANPFFEIDFSKFADLSKMAGDFKAPLSMEPLMAAQQRNIETMTAVCKSACESMQALGRRQADMMRQSLESVTGVMSSMMSSPASPEEKMISQVEASKAAVEKCMANARDVADTFSKCNAEAMEAVNNRLNEGLEELRSMIKSRQQNAA